MPQLQHIYDGKNTAVNLGTGERLDRAQEGMNNLILQAEKLRLDSFKKNEEWFLKSQDVDLETYISTANTETQAQLVDAYNAQAKEMLKKRGGDFNNLTTQDKLELAKGRKVLESEQKRMLGDLEKYKMAKAVVDRNPAYYDSQKFNETIGTTYLKNGRFPDVELPIRPKSASTYLSSHKIKGQNAWSELKTAEGNPEKEIQYEYSAKKADVVPVVTGLALGDPQFMEEAKADWEALTDDQKKDYLDGNTDVVREYSAMGVTNPILMNYAEKHWQDGVDVSIGAPQQKKRSTGTGGGFSISFGGNNVKMSPGYKNPRPISYGNKVFDNSYTFPSKTPISNVKTDGGIIYQNMTSRKAPAGNVQGYLKDYIADTDMVIIETTKGYSDFGISSGANIAVPAESISDINNLPIKGDDGVMTTLGEIRKAKQGGATTSTPKKKVYNPKTGKIE